MFKTLEVLNQEKHANLTYKGVPGFDHARSLTSAPLAVTEMAEAARHFPILFPTEGRLLPVALLGLRKEESLFVDPRGNWTADYIPAHIRRYPFVLGATGDKGRHVVMIDRAAPQFAAPDGAPLFDEGEDKVLPQARKFLAELQKGLEHSERLLQPLVDKGVLIGRQINIRREGRSEVAVQGFRQVDEKAVAALDDATLAAWVRGGLMGAVIAHLHSLNNVKRLLRLQEARGQGAAQ